MEAAPLMSRIPELEPLCADAKIRRAVESGDPIRTYHALYFARLFGRLPHMQGTLDALLADRRRFAKVGESSPSLFTLNSLGTGFVGSADQAADGTYIATHALVILYKLPLLPLGAWVVRPAGGSKWSIFARVPLAGWALLHRAVVGFGACAAVLASIALAMHARAHQDVRVLNAFDKPLQITLGDRSATVPARGDVVLGSVSTGKHQARASDGARVIDALELDVHSGADVFAWNIAGAMPLVSYQVVYTAKGSKEPDKSQVPKPRVFCGERVVDLAKVDFPFREAAQSIQMPSGQAHVYRTRVIYEAPSGRDLAMTCSQWLDDQGRAADALAVAEASADLAGWQRAAAVAAVGEATKLADNAAALRLARKWRDAQPSEVDAHRSYQQLSLRSGQSAAVLAEYKARAEAEPASADAQYLYLRLQHGAAAADRIQALVERFPAHVPLLRALLWQRVEAFDWPGVLDAWGRLDAQSPREAALHADDRVWALAALDRTADALAAARAGFHALENVAPFTRSKLAAMFARVAVRSPGSLRDELFVLFEAAGQSAPGARLRGGLPVPAGAKAPGLALTRAILTDPDQALELAAAGSLEDVQALDDVAWWLAYFEAARRGQAKAEESLLRWSGRPLAEDLPPLRKFVRGEAPAIGELDLGPEARAAAWLVRSRNPSLTPEERKAARDEAARIDVLHGPVTDALKSWKA